MSPTMEVRQRSAGVVVVRDSAAGWRFLLLRAWHNWDFPKGAIEPGETPRQAALREVAEETGLTGLRFLRGEGYCETEPYGHGKVSRYYLAEAPEGTVVLGVNPDLGRPEHHQFRWVEPTVARQLLPPRLQPVLAWARSRLRETVTG